LFSFNRPNTGVATVASPREPFTNSLYKVSPSTSPKPSSSLSL
jgi:hypothetical protein